MGYDEEIEIMDIIKTLWREKIVIGIILLIAICGGIIYTNAVEPKYQSTAKILIDRGDASIESMINNEDIINGAIEQLGISRETLVSSKKTGFDKSTKIITLTFSSENPQLAYDMVNAYKDAIKIKLEEVYNIKQFNIMEQAEVSLEPYNINHIKDLIIAIGVGIMLIGVYVFILVNRKGVRKEETIESNGLILLGKIKKDKKNDKKINSYVIREENVQEELRKIIAKIEFNKNLERPKTILFTGAKAKIGNSYVVANLAYKNAKLGKKVLIVDANLNSPIQHKIFNVNETPGLIDLLTSEESNISNYIINSSIENLSVLPHGAEKKEEILNIDRFIQILQKMQNKYDIILIDGMPITQEVLTIALANIADATVIVIEYEKSKIEDLINIKRLVQDINGRISGVIMNKV